MLPTLLTNRKMDPALRARIEKSLEARGSAEASAARLRALMRFASLAIIVFLIGYVLSKRHAAKSALETQRTTLLDSWTKKTSEITPDDKKAIARNEALLQSLAGVYEGDLAKPADVTRTIVYVRGPIESFRSATTIPKAAAQSLEDAFARCFVEPPRTKGEKDVLAKVRAVYTGSLGGLKNLERLETAYATTRLLEPDWLARAKSSPSEKELGAMQTELDHTPFDRALLAWRAELLLAVMDEPGEANVPAELDGERPHDVRVALVETKTGNALLRMHAHVDPSVWNAGTRPEYASGLDACALAFEARALLGATR
jgi:hypothetical protein